jgi:hypothetical protein
MREPKSHVHEAERRDRDADPEKPIPQHRPLQREHTHVLFDDRPVGHHLVHDREHADRVSRQCDLGTRDAREIQEYRDRVGDEEQAERAHVGRHWPPGQQRGRELNRRRNERVRQTDEHVRTEICSRPERADDVRIHSRRVYREQAADLHTQQDQGIESKCGEKSSAEVLGLADGARVDERVHPRMHVPSGRLAGDHRRRQQPDLAAEDGNRGNDERRVENEILRQRDRDYSYSRREEREYDQDGEG